jgi:hypothetical protein
MEERERFYSFILSRTPHEIIKFIIINISHCDSLLHRLSINRPTKRGKEKSPSDGHCQCKKEIDDHLLACQHFLTKSYIGTRLAIERASFLNMHDITDISFFGTSYSYNYCCSIARSMVSSIPHN